MPADLVETFAALSNDVVWLHAKWRLYRQLFVDEDHIDILNEAGGFVAYTVQDILWRDVVLH
jgi:hypothetical protein